MTTFAWKSTGAAALALSLLAGTAHAAPVTDATVAFLMPDQASTRYEQHDYPGFAAEMKKLCPGCKVLYQNADADASRQQQQFNSVISQGAKAIVLDPVDSTAAANVAVKLLSGETPKAEMTLYDTPSQLFTPAVVTQENLKAEIIDKKINTAAELCVDRYAEGCKKLGITN